MNNVINQIPFLRTSRSFPEEISELCVHLNKSYIDIANAVNARTISLFPVNRPANNGESWYFTGNKRQQGFRQIYEISSYSTFNHGLDFNSINFFTKIYGIGYDGTNYFPIPYVSPVAVTGQVGIFVTPTQVIITSGVGSPVITSGIIILEWITYP